MNDWTVATLKDHFDRRFEDAKTAVDAAFASSANIARIVAEGYEKQFRAVNEMRGMAEDIQKFSYPRPEAEVEIRAIKQRLIDLEDANKNRASESRGGKNLWAIIITAIAAIGGTIAIMRALAG